METRIVLYHLSDRVDMALWVFLLDPYNRLPYSAVAAQHVSEDIVRYVLPIGETSR